MARIDWQQHVRVDPEIHHGEPCIQGTRIPLRMILGSLADGMTVEALRQEYPQLTLANIQGALAYAAEILRQDVLMPLQPAPAA